MCKRLDPVQERRAQSPLVSVQNRALPTRDRTCGKGFTSGRSRPATFETGSPSTRVLRHRHGAATVPCEPRRGREPVHGRAIQYEFEFRLLVT